MEISWKTREENECQVVPCEVIICNKSEFHKFIIFSSFTSLNFVKFGRFKLKLFLILRSVLKTGCYLHWNKNAPSLNYSYLPRSSVI